jgi:hypothetical protein
MILVEWLYLLHLALIHGCKNCARTALRRHSYWSGLVVNIATSPLTDNIRHDFLDVFRPSRRRGLLQRVRFSNRTLILCERDALYDATVFCSLDLEEPAKGAARIRSSPSSSMIASTSRNPSRTSWGHLLCGSGMAKRTTSAAEVSPDVDVQGAFLSAPYANNSFMTSMTCKACATISCRRSRIWNAFMST